MAHNMLLEGRLQHLSGEHLNCIINLRNSDQSTGCVLQALRGLFLHLLHTQMIISRWTVLRSPKWGWMSLSLPRSALGSPRLGRVRHVFWSPFSLCKSNWSLQGLHSCPLISFVLVEELSPDRYRVGPGPPQATAMLEDKLCETKSSH